jgi:hypothetical protein
MPALAPVERPPLLLSPEPLLPAGGVCVSEVPVDTTVSLEVMVLVVVMVVLALAWKVSVTKDVA